MESGDRIGTCISLHTGYENVNRRVSLERSSNCMKVTSTVVGLIALFAAFYDYDAVGNILVGIGF